jgi:hypothetical protein
VRGRHSERVANHTDLLYAVSRAGINHFETFLTKRNNDPVEPAHAAIQPFVGVYL